MIFTIKSHEIEEYRPHLSRVLGIIDDLSDLVTAEDVLRQVEAAQAQMWGWSEGGEIKAAVCTRIYEMAKGKLCTIWIAVGYGEKENILKIHDEIEAWARSIGCYSLEIVGREGWVKTLPGYRKSAVVMEKILERAH